jgi:hypothetical protein
MSPLPDEEPTSHLQKPKALVATPSGNKAIKIRGRSLTATTQALRSEIDVWRFLAYSPFLAHPGIRPK